MDAHALVHMDTAVSNECLRIPPAIHCMCLDCEANPTFLVSASSTNMFTNAKAKKLHMLIESTACLNSNGSYSRERRPTVQYEAGPAVCYKKKKPVTVARRVRSTPAFAIVTLEEEEAVVSKKRARDVAPVERFENSLGERFDEDATEGMISMSQTEMNAFVSDPIDGVSIAVLDGISIAESKTPICAKTGLPPLPDPVIGVLHDDGIEEEEDSSVENDSLEDRVDDEVAARAPAAKASWRRAMVH